MSAAEEREKTAAAVRELGALPVPVGPEPDADAVRLELFEEELATTARLRLALESAQRGRRELRSALRFSEPSRERWRAAAIEVTQERDALRARVAELEALTPAEIQTCRVCGAGYTYGQPCSVCEFRARMAAEIDGASGPSPVESADRLTRFFAPTQALREEAAEECELIVFRASHDSIVMGRYSDREAARKHCETLLRRELGDEEWTGWVPDDGSEDAPEELCFSKEVLCSGYVVTALAIASAYDAEADE